MNQCAVVGCSNEGRRQVCPYDGRNHYHGRIHYDCPRAEPTKLRFRDGDWYLICNEHYGVLIAEMLEREGERALCE